MLEKIWFDDKTYLWKTKLNLSESNRSLLLESTNLINKVTHIKHKDNFGHKLIRKDINFIGEIDVKTQLDNVCQLSILHCKSLYEELNIPYNKMYMDSWVNVVKAKKPVQSKYKNDILEGDDKFHTHTEINKELKSFIPTYTYVYYIQMPDIMNDEDGVLYFKGNNKKEYWIRPEEDDLIIMPADMPHGPQSAPNSSLDRIVIAGNVGFEFHKKEKSLL